MQNSANIVWDWADNISTLTRLLYERNTLSHKIATAQNTCGSCIKWMTNQCSREKPIGNSGRKIGPSCNTWKCKDFLIKKDIEEGIEKDKAKLLKIMEELSINNRE